MHILRRRSRLSASLNIIIVWLLLGAALIGPLVRVARAEDAGYALAFDGLSDFVVLHATADMLGPGWEATKTISLWVRPFGPGAVCPNGSPAWCDAVFGDRPRWWGISRGILSGQDRLWVFNYDGSPGSAMDVVGLEYIPDQWIHIAIVHSAGLLQIYVNGQLVAVISSGATMQPNTGAHPVLHLGGIINSTSRNWTFAGEIDEVSFWNVPRTQAEIQQDQFGSLDGTETGLAAYYSMSDGSGTALTDDSGHGWTGTLMDGGRGVPPDGPILWVASGAFDGAPATATPTGPTPTDTLSPEPPTATSTAEPTATASATSTSEPPTATSTPGAATATNTATATASGTPTATAVPATPTDTQLPPTATSTPPPTPTWTTAPPSATPSSGDGYALLFDGANDYVELPAVASILGSNWQTAKTVSLWVKPEGFDTCQSADPASCDAIFGDRPRTWGIVRGALGGLDRIWVWNYDGTFDRIGAEYTSGVWTYISLVHGDGLLRFFKDGVEIGSIPSGPTQHPGGGATSPLHIGGIVRTSSSYWMSRGLIDEFLLWNTARTAAEVQADMFRTAFDGEQGLQAHYRMSDGAGLTLTDDSGHGWTGTLHDGGRGLPGDGIGPLWVTPGALSGTPPTPTSTSLPPTSTEMAQTATPTGTQALASPTPTLPSATPSLTPVEPTPTSTATPAEPSPTATATFTPAPSPTPTPMPATPTEAPTATATPTSSPGTLFEVASYALPDDAYDLVWHAGHVFVADIGAGLRIMNVSDPFNPFEVGFYDAVGPVYGVAVAGDYAYLAEGREGLRIVDISDLSQPVSVGQADTPEYAWGVAVAGQTAFIADRWGGVHIFDVANPAAPIEIASYPTPDQATGVAVAGSYLYVAAYHDGGLRILDVTNPASPLEVGVYDTTGSPYNVTVAGQYAYVADGGSGLRIIDVADPAHPVEVGAYDTAGWSRDVVVRGDLAYLADDGLGGFRLIDVSNRAAPFEVAAYDTVGRPRGVDTDGTFIYVADYEGGLRILALA